MTTIYVTAVHMSGGDKHEHIAEVQWRNRVTSESGTMSRAEMVRWITTRGNEARVADPLAPGYVRVGVVNAPTPYIRTYRDNTPTDNLLYLPRY